jgi:hypothetical protein
MCEIFRANNQFEQSSFDLVSYSALYISIKATVVFVYKDIRGFTILSFGLIFLDALYKTVR